MNKRTFIAKLIFRNSNSVNVVDFILSVIQHDIYGVDQIGNIDKKSIIGTKTTIEIECDSNNDGYIKKITKLSDNNFYNFSVSEDVDVANEVMGISEYNRLIVGEMTIEFNDKLVSRLLGEIELYTSHNLYFYLNDRGDGVASRTCIINIVDELVLLNTNDTLKENCNGILNKVFNWFK